MAAMIRSTFVHLPGIGLATERRLWTSGLQDWRDLLGTSLGRRYEIAAELDRSEQAYSLHDASYFFEKLPPSERWRLLADFEPEFVALDIETTGLSVYDRLTVVGLESNGVYRAYVEGSNLLDLKGELEKAAGVITFNGSLFDLPFLRRSIPELRLPTAHIDLRFLGRRAGLRGSLKVVEHEAGLDRPGDLRSMGGYEATVLWSRFEHGDHEALELLVRYNAADTCNLRRLSSIVLERLHSRFLQNLEAGLQPFLPEFKSDSLARIPDSFNPSPSLPNIWREAGWLNVGQARVPIPRRGRSRPKVRIQRLLERTQEPAARIIGIDLTGSEARSSGWALLQGDLVKTLLLNTSEEIVRITVEQEPALVSIDSPLSLPLGRDCTEDDCSCRRFGITRGCERELRRRGINVYPCLIPSMQKLTRRGIEIAEQLRKAGIEVIESYPGAAQDIMGIPRKRASLDQLRAGLVNFGIRGGRPLEKMSHDELDAITSAVVGTFYLAGLAEGLGASEEGQLIVPLASNDLVNAFDSSGAALLNRAPIIYVPNQPAADDVLQSKGRTTVSGLTSCVQ